MMLTERKKADRETMAAMVAALCVEMGAACEVRDMATYVYSDGSRSSRSREIRCLIELGDARIGIDFDGESNQPDCYCMPWNTRFDSGARMTPAFGVAVGAQVNPHHRAKCMGFADGIDALLSRLRAAMACVNRGEAFESTEERVAA